ncbi:DUF6292 family protein [Saccharothrix sp. NRRL B-16314]|uniref:DUF6292 family protein n=1 Tax=Saccharothrix sp. NRRL B-16314 TaxID=1463825 RepID=UPI00068AB464|nr:DUF6292 family protein [Saccharothrix sp. NRRL B-16314]
MELDFDDALVLGLRGYVRLVTEEVGLSGECSYVHADPAAAYLALDGRLPGFPDRDVALLWDEDGGWSVAVETHSGEDLIVCAYFGADILPPPAAVARWVRGLLRGERRPTSRPGKRKVHGDLVRLVAPYATALLVPAPRTARLSEAAPDDAA